MIVITLNGGLVQGVSSDDPADKGKQVVVIDYDVEGAEPEEVDQIPQGDGKTQDAAVSGHEIGVLYGPITEFLKAKITACTQCGKPYFVEGNGVSHHALEDAPDGIDHDADADHVPHGDVERHSSQQEDQT